MSDMPGFSQRLRDAIEWWMVRELEDDEDDQDGARAWHSEDARSIHMRWGIVLHTREIGDRWVWAATTAGGETCLLTGAMLEIAGCYPLWLWGQPGAVYSISDATHVLGEHEPATHLALTHIVRSRPPGLTTDIVSYHAAAEHSRTLYFLSPERLEGWPP